MDSLNRVKTNETAPSGDRITYAVEVYLDPESAAIVSRTWGRLADAGISRSMLREGYRPHWSLAVSKDLDVDGLARDMDMFVAKWEPLPVTLSSIGVFPTDEGVLYYGVVVTHDLVQRHAEFFELFPKHAENLREYYLPGNWVPHCTLAYWLPIDELGNAMKIARETPLPIRCRTVEIAIVDFPPDRCNMIQSWRLEQ